MKKLFQWALAAALICGISFAAASCSKDDDGDNVEVLTAEQLAGLWVTEYAESGTDGDRSWTRAVEDYLFRADGTGYYENYRLDGQKFVKAISVRDEGALHYTITGNTVTVKGDESNQTQTLTYAGGKLTVQGKTMQKATAEQQTLVEQLYADWQGGNSSSNLVSYIEYVWNGTEVEKKYHYDRAYRINDLSTQKSHSISGLYYIEGSYTSSHTLSVNGSADIILCDGCVMTLDGITVNNGATLRIFGQDRGNGRLVIRRKDDDKTFLPAIGAYKGDGGVVEIHGGDIDARGGNCSAGIGGGSTDSGSFADEANLSAITIYNGRVFAAGKGGAGIGSGVTKTNVEPTITIYGGVVEGRCFNSNKGAYLYGAGIGGSTYSGFASVNIYGGVVSAYGNDESAGIGAGQDAPKGKGVVNIYGGYVLAQGGDRGAGIGGGDGRCLDQINIHGGEVYAYAGVDGAGIGGGEGGNSGYITITGGTVRAYGDRDYEGDEIKGYGAGIGSGQDGIAYTIKISGGDIVAYGGWDAAGIGTGEETSIWAYINTIQISGGKVYAKGKRYGVGIGVGEDGHCDIGKIEITGGRVDAHGDENYCGNWTGAMGAFHEDHRDNDWQDCKTGKYGWGRIYIGKGMRLWTYTPYNSYVENVTNNLSWWDFVHGRPQVAFGECDHPGYTEATCPFCYRETVQLR